MSTTAQDLLMYIDCAQQSIIPAMTNMFNGIAWTYAQHIIAGTY